MKAGWRWTVGIAGLALALAAGCTSGPAAAAPGYRAVSLEPGDGITINDTTEDVTIDVTSERGIGKVEIVRSGPPPKSLTINYQLKGLEESRLGWGDTSVIVHVASGSGRVIEEVSQNGGQATPIDSTSPYWAPVTIEAQAPQIPLENGYFAVTAPPAFLQAAPQRFSLQWIDFYR